MNHDDWIYLCVIAFFVLALTSPIWVPAVANLIGGLP